MTVLAPPFVGPTIVLPLQNGDNLSADEFERRYEVMPPGVRAELIEGVVYLSAAVSHDFHSEPHFDPIGCLSVHKRATPGVVGGDNGTCRLDTGNLPQPDIYLMIASGPGSRSGPT